MTSVATEGLPDRGRGRPTVVHTGLGVLAAILAPPIVMTLVLLITSEPDGISTIKAMLSLFEFNMVTALLTVPATLLYGLPAICIFRARGWHDWPRHALAGFAIGSLAGVPISVITMDLSSDVSEFFGASAFFAAFGVLSAIVYWIIVYGRNRALWLSGTMGLGVILLWIFWHFSR